MLEVLRNWKLKPGYDLSQKVNGSDCMTIITTIIAMITLTLTTIPMAMDTDTVM